MSGSKSGTAGYGHPVSAKNVKASNSAPSSQSFERTLRDMSNETTAKTFDFNSEEAQKGRDFQEYMSNTSHQREVEDLRNAGLNPVLSANSGAQSYSASTASGTADNSAIGALSSIYMNKMTNQTNARIAAENRKNELKIAKINENIANNNNLSNKEIARINASAQKYSSDNAYAASRYSSDNSYASTIYNTDVSSATSKENSKRQYKSTDYGALDDIFGNGKTGKIAKGAYVGTKALSNVLGSIGKFKGKPHSPYQVSYKKKK